MMQKNLTTNKHTSLTRKHPLVSIVIATHNRSDLLQRAIHSLLNQTYKNIEILVVDDGSVDDTQEILKKYTDSRIHVLKNSVAKGACHARNRGIFSAKGEFITFLDDDDEFFSDRIEKMMAAWDDKWAYIATGFKYITKTKESKRIPRKIITLNDMLFQINTGNSILTKKERLIALGGFDENLASSQDYDMWIRLNYDYGNAYCIQEVLFSMHTEHEKPRITMSKRKFQGHFSFYKKHKSIMNYEQRKSKIFELVKYKNKKTRLIKFYQLGHKRSKSEVMKFYLGQKFPNLKKYFFEIKTKLNR